MRVCIPVSYLEDNVTEINWGSCSFRICSAIVKSVERVKQESLPMACLCERKESKTTSTKALTNMLRVNLFKAVQTIKGSTCRTYTAAHNHLELQFQGSNSRSHEGATSSSSSSPSLPLPHPHTHTISKYIFNKKSQYKVTLVMVTQALILRRLREKEYQEFKASSGYRVRHCLQSIKIQTIQHNKHNTATERNVLTDRHWDS